MPGLPPVPAQISQAPHPLEATALGLCRTLSTHLQLDAESDPGQLQALKGQVAALLPVCAKVLPTGNRIVPLLEAGLGALEAATGQEARGERRFAQAARILARQWREAQVAAGPNSPRCLPELEALGLLYEFGGLRSTAWRAQSIQLRLAASRAPDPALEEWLVQAVTDHYGGWLTPVELQPLLEASAQLTRLWLRHPSDDALTRRVLALGFRPDADRVWCLVAQKAPEPLLQDLANLIGRLQVSPLGADLDARANALVAWAEALLDTPLEGPARAFLQRLERGLKAQGDPRWLGLRRAIAKAQRDPAAEADLLKEELAAAERAVDLIPALFAAEGLLRTHPNPDLLETGTRRLQALLVAPMDPGLARTLEAWGQLLGEAGQRQEQAALLAWLPAAAPPPEPAAAPAPGWQAPPAASAQVPPEPAPAPAPAAASIPVPPLEAALRQRRSDLPMGQGRIPALQALIRDTQARLRPTHPLVGELLGELGELEGAEGGPHLEQALAILEAAPQGAEQTIIKLYDTLLCASILDPVRMERYIQRLLSTLETFPVLDGQTREWARGVVPIMALQLLRAERLDDLLRMAPRLLALLRRAAGPGFTLGEKDFAAALPKIQRMARFQEHLRAAGLP